MSLASNLVLASVSALNPAFGVFGSVIKWVTSEQENSGSIFVLDLFGNFIPGGFAKDLLYSGLIDVYETRNSSEGVEEVVPYSSISVCCSNCNCLTNYYVLNEGRLICKSCYADNIYDVTKDSNLYIIRNRIQTLHSKIISSNDCNNKSLNSRDLTGRNLENRILE